MRLEVLEDENLIIHETGGQKNGIEYDSRDDLDNYTRSKLSYIESFLEEHKQFKEANRIKNHLGKILKLRKIPELIPVGNYMVNSPLEFLKDKIDRFIKEENLQINPDFQRVHVWNMEQRVKYVEFLLQGGKSNPIYFNHPNWMSRGNKSRYNDFVLVDGKQRLTSILMFLNNEFRVFKNLDTENEGFYCDELDTLGWVDVVIVINDLDSKEKVLRWYLQMNRGNVAHTEEELQKVEELLKKENNN